MRILLLASAFNGLTQRLQRELVLLNHYVAVELVNDPATMQQAVDLVCPDLILCPFLKKRIPETIWKRHLCLIVHPGIEGDRGPSSLDWALQRRKSQWGVTLLQAAEELDAGQVWGSATFELRGVSKAAMYRREVTEHAVRLSLNAVLKLQDRNFQVPLLTAEPTEVTGCFQRPMVQEDRGIDWQSDTTETIIAHINAADSAPGVLDEINGHAVYLYGASKAIGLHGAPGELIAHSHGAICCATVDGAVWISHLKHALGPQRMIKLPATHILGDAMYALPHIDTDAIGASDVGCNEIRYYEIGEVGYVHFDFYNGAMNTQQCERLTQVLRQVKRRPVKVIALMGGEQFFSNGIHLNCIEAAENPAEESWANINAMNDVVAEILETEHQVTVAVVRGNAGAGGAVLAAACDHVWIREGAVLNVHYQTMGLYGSEYSTYVLPRRVGIANAQRLTQECLPTLAREARNIGFADRLLPEDWHNCQRELDRLLAGLTEPMSFKRAVVEKVKQRDRDEARKPLQNYREEELSRMRAQFFNLYSDYHAARHRFVCKVAVAGTPIRIAPHRVIEPLKKSA